MNETCERSGEGDEGKWHKALKLTRDWRKEKVRLTCMNKWNNESLWIKWDKGLWVGVKLKFDIWYRWILLWVGGFWADFFVFLIISLNKFYYNNVILLVLLKKIKKIIIFVISLLSLKKMNIVCWVCYIWKTQISIFILIILFYIKKLYKISFVIYTQISTKYRW